MTGVRTAMGEWSLLALWWGLARMLGRSARLCTLRSQESDAHVRQANVFLSAGLRLTATTLLLQTANHISTARSDVD